MDQTNKFSLVTKRLVIGARRRVPRMLLRERRQWQTLRSGGLAKDGMAWQGACLQAVFSYQLQWLLWDRAILPNGSYHFWTTGGHNGSGE